MDDRLNGEIDCKWSGKLLGITSYYMKAFLVSEVIHESHRLFWGVSFADGANRQKPAVTDIVLLKERWCRTYFR
jgi:hypothetical protein